MSSMYVTGINEANLTAPPLYNPLHFYIEATILTN
jgi:hypothetical protein